MDIASVHGLEAVSAKCIIATVQELCHASLTLLSGLKVVLHNFVSLSPRDVHPLPAVALGEPWHEPQEDCWVPCSFAEIAEV